LEYYGKASQKEKKSLALKNTLALHISTVTTYMQTFSKHKPILHPDAGSRIAILEESSSK
jgi:hypothetical protein